MPTHDQFALGDRVQIAPDHWDPRLAGRTGTIAPHPDGVVRNPDSVWIELDVTELHLGDVDGAEVEVVRLRRV